MNTCNIYILVIVPGIPIIKYKFLGKYKTGKTVTLLAKKKAKN